MQVNFERGSDVDLNENVGLIEEGENKQFVTFYIGEECFGFEMKTVQEIIWVPDTVSVPLTPTSFLGLANLRGSILPVLDLRVILGQKIKDLTDASRVVIVNVGYSVGFLVDKVDRVIQVEGLEEVRDSEDKIHTELLLGVVRHPQNSSKLIQILDVERIVEREFVFEERKTSSQIELTKSKDLVHSSEDSEEHLLQLVSFYLDGQEFALEVFDVKEIIRFPEEIYEVPNTDPALMGIISYRDEMLPLINLNKILGLNFSHDPEQSKVLVTNIECERRKHLVGLVVDRVCEILKINEKNWESVSELFDESNQSEIKGVCKLEGGKRIVSVLSLKGMTAHPAIEAAITISHEHKEKKMEENSKELKEEEEIQLVVFKLQNEEYGIFIEHIQEIILMPEEINVIPKTPDYIEGMINLRGSVLPVIDMRKRLGLPSIERAESQRILVLNAGGVRMGFIVDSVVEVLCVVKKDVEDIPKMSSEQAAVLDRVINLKDKSRIILIINVEKLLHEEELEEISTITDSLKKEEEDA